MVKTSSVFCLVAYFLASSAKISMLWNLRPALAWSARHHRRVAYSSLTSTAGRLTPNSPSANIIHQRRLEESRLSIGVMPYFNAVKIYRERTTKRFMVSNEFGGEVTFVAGDKIQVEVVNFGPLGASVEVIGLGHGDDVPLLPADAPEAYGYGLILQKEISYFRNARNNIDVVRGEILPAYVQNVRPEDGKLDISLRSFGGKAKSLDAGAQILERLEEIGGRLDIGEKSTPQEINDEFPGVSKSVFKKVICATVDIERNEFLLNAECIIMLIISLFIFILTLFLDHRLTLRFFCFRDRRSEAYTKKDW